MDNEYQWMPFYGALAGNLFVYNDIRDGTQKLIGKAGQGYAN